MNDPIKLVEELRAKSWASARYKHGQQNKPREEHVCYRAAEKLEELIRGKNGSIPIRAVREIFTRLLNLSYDQRAYSWHEIQNCLKEIEKARDD